MSLLDFAHDITGPFRRPRNLASGLGAGSIHDDATASKLGFRGGTIAGSIHMDQFAPMLVSIFGDQWFEHGGISLYFTKATIDNEPVRAFAKREAGAPRATLRMEDDRGDQICQGTASIGATDGESEVRRLLARQASAEKLRIFGHVKVGDSFENVESPVTEVSDLRLDAITECLPAYLGKDRWAGKVAPTSMVVHACRMVQSKILQRPTSVVGLFGALEVQYHNGPLIVGKTYNGRGRIVGLTESPKTENVWWEATLADPDTGKDVVTHLQYLRFMKASSEFYTDAKA